MGHVKNDELLPAVTITRMYTDISIITKKFSVKNLILIHVNCEMPRFHHFFVSINDPICSGLFTFNIVIENA